MFVLPSSTKSKNDISLNSPTCHVNVNQCSQLGVYGIKRSLVIGCTSLRCADIPTDTCKAIWPSFFKEEHKNCQTVPSMLQYLEFEMSATSCYD